MSHAIRSSTTEENWFEINSTLVDELIAKPLPSPDKQLQNLVSWLKLQAADRPFSEIQIQNPAATAAIVGAADTQNFDALLAFAASEGWLTVEDKDGSVSLTAKAWRENEMSALPPAAKHRGGDDAATQGHCPRCGPGRHADIKAEHVELIEDKDAPVWAETTYRVLRCRGCHSVFVQRVHIFSEDYDMDHDPISGETRVEYNEDISYWPAPARRKRPDWLGKITDRDLASVLDEVYQALDADQRVLAAIGARTALDRAMVLAGADAAHNFREKLDFLETSGIISKHERDILVTLTDAGSAAAHRAWKPDPERLQTILEGTEAFLHRSLVLGAAVRAIKADVPRRQRRNPKRPD